MAEKLSEKIKFFYQYPLEITKPLAAIAPIAIVLGPAPADIVCSLIAIVFLLEKIRVRDFAWTKQPWVKAALLLWAYGFARTAFAYTEFDGLWQSFVWLRYIIFAAALADTALADDLWRRRMFYSLVAATSFLAADACFQYLTGFDVIGNRIKGNRLTAIYGSPKVGITLAWLFFPAMMAFLQEEKKKAALLYGGLCFLAILLSGDRFAFLATLTYFALAPLFEPKIRKAALFGGLILLIAAGGALAIFPELYKRQVDSTAVALRNFPRTSYALIWKSALDITKENPLLGIGIRNFRHVCPDEHFGVLRETKNSPSRCAQHPHNIYMEWLSEGGILGLSGLLAFVVLAMAQLIKGRPQEQNRLIYLGIVLTLAIRFWPLASTTSFFNNWAAIPLWLMLGWGLALARQKNS